MVAHCAVDCEKPFELESSGTRKENKIYRSVASRTSCRLTPSQAPVASGDTSGLQSEKFGGSSGAAAAAMHRPLSHDVPTAPHTKFRYICGAGGGRSRGVRVG
jgi:hypothetical protein